MAKFPEGTVVELKSGGPHMTATGTASGAPGKVYCEWFDGNTLKGASFDEESLKPAEPKHVSVGSRPRSRR